MSSKRLCLTPRDLDRLAQDQLSDEELERACQHLEECPRCLGTVAGAADDTLTAALREINPEEMEAADSAVTLGLVKRLEGLRVATADTDTGGVRPSRFKERDRELHAFLAPPQTADELGRLGHYRVLKVLGSGGMGVVFQAEEPSLKRQVALKAMLPGLAVTASARQRFLREAQAVAAIAHDHIVPIHYIGEDRGVPFIVMPLLQGEPLDQRLERDGRLPLPEALRIGREIAEGLAAAHERGLIHRDIKPGNIWLETGRVVSGEVVSGKEPGHLPRTTHHSPARVKILDFGLARTLDGGPNLTGAGAIVGTPAYMSPEQAHGEAVDGRCDLFSLGCVLYEMCCGRRPFQGKDAVSTLMAVATEQPPPPRTLNPAISPELETLILRLLAKDRRERPESPAVVAAALADVTQAIGRPERRRHWWPRAAAARRKKRLLWTGTGLLSVFAAALLLFWQTPRGLVRIESNDPSVEIVFDGTGPTISGAGKEPITLSAGAHGLLVKRADFSFGTDKIFIKKGQTVTLKIELLGNQVRILREGRLFASRDISLSKTFTNRLGMEFVLVPRGKSWLGGSKDNLGTEMDMPHDFYLGKYEVTQKQWQKVAGFNPSSFKGPANSRLPVEMVSWDDCQVFIQRVNEQAKEPGWVYRLPTAVEWEYACRGGPMKDKFDSVFDFYLERPTNTVSPHQANFRGPNDLKRICKVGSYPPNLLGLHDMHGNVFEWCQDEPVDRKGTLQRVNRGGAWHDDASHGRASDSYVYPASGRSPCIGLRLARVPAGAQMVR